MLITCVRIRSLPKVPLRARFLHTGSGAKPLVGGPLSALVMQGMSKAALGVPSPKQVSEFQEKGFLCVKNVISQDQCDAINSRVDAAFEGRFDTYNYPDEWYWRKEISLPYVTRHMCNLWKADRGVAAFVMSETLARFAASLLGVDGLRIGNDSVWIKPPNAAKSEVSYHRDSMYVPFGPFITCWLTLTPVSAANGTLEYVPGSHRWKQVADIDRAAFHSPKTGFRAPAHEAAQDSGVDPNSLVFEPVELPAGSIAFHHGDTWHGSSANLDSSLWRRSLGIHLVHDKVKHSPGGGYIYGRYQRWGSDELDEAFFPIVYRKDGYRSPFLSQFLDLSSPPYPAR